MFSKEVQKIFGNNVISYFYELKRISKEFEGNHYLMGSTQRFFNLINECIDEDEIDWVSLVNHEHKIRPCFSDIRTYASKTYEDRERRNQVVSFIDKLMNDADFLSVFRPAKPSVVFNEKQYQLYKNIGSLSEDEADSIGVRYIRDLAVASTTVFPVIFTYSATCSLDSLIDDLEDSEWCSENKDIANKLKHEESSNVNVFFTESGEIGKITLGSLSALAAMADTDK